MPAFLRFFPRKLLLLALLAAVAPVAPGHAQARGGAPPEAPAASYRGQSFPQQRTPIEALPLGGQAEILRLETLLDQAYAALTASPTAAVFPPILAEAVAQAAEQAAAVAPTWNQDAYRREAAFYAAEEARRHPAPAQRQAPAAAPKGTGGRQKASRPFGVVNPGPGARKIRVTALGWSA